MLDAEKAAEEFQRADDALNAIILAPNAIEAEVDKAIAAQETLALRFTADAIRSANNRTALFQRFIKAMESVLDGIGRDSPLEGIRQLQAIIDQSKDLLTEASEESDSPDPGVRIGTDRPANSSTRKRKKS